MRATFDSLKFDTPVASVCKCVFATCDTKGDSSNEQRLCSLPASWPLFVCSTDLTCLCLCPCLHSISVRHPVRLSVCLSRPPCDLQLTATAAPASRKHFTLCEWTPPSHTPLSPPLSLFLWFYSPSSYTLPHLCMHQFLVISCYFVLYMYNLLDFVHIFLLLKICFYFSPSSSPSLLLGLVRRPVRPFGY